MGDSGSSGGDARDGAPLAGRPGRARLEADGADVEALIAEAGDVSNARTLLTNFIAAVR